jgi:hypothetical protein
MKLPGMQREICVPSRTLDKARVVMHRSFVLTWGEWAVLTTLMVVVSAVTGAERARLIPLSVFAASPHAVAEAHIWLLLTSALLVQSPYFWSLVTFGLLGALTLAVCGGRALWLSALAGHIGSTLLVYALLAAVHTAKPHAFEGLQTAPDYGVSAISSAWLGAIAAASWRARDRTPHGRFAIGLAVVAMALFGWMLRRHLSFLDLEHVVAFGIGITVVVQLSAARVRTQAAHQAATS